MMRLPLRRIAALVGCTGVLIGCTSSGGDALPPFETVPIPVETTQAPTTTELPGASTTTTLQPNVNLVGKCSNPVVIQLDSTINLWALPYVHLLGPDGEGDATSYRAPLVNRDGTSTGVDIELRTSGRLPLDADASSALNDPSVLFATTKIQDVLPEGKSRTVIVAAPWARGDLGLQWIATSPAMQTISDIAGITIANPEVDPKAADYLKGSGLLPDPSRAGAVRQDVETVPKNATASLVHMLELPAASVPPGLTGPRTQLLAEVGWEPYPHALVVNALSAKERADCIRAIVPLVQYATLRLSVEPRRTVKRLAGINERMGLAIDGERVAAELAQAIRLELLGTGNQVSPIAADPAVARLVQLAKAQRTSAAVRKENVEKPKDFEKAVRKLVDRSFIDSDLKYTVRTKPGFLDGDI